MATSSQQQGIADYYYGLLRNLSPFSKRELISKLTKSLEEKPLQSALSLEKLFGAFQSEHTAEEIIAEIRQSRVFTRTVDPL